MFFDTLAPSCQPFGQRVCHVSFGGLDEGPHPSGKTGNVYRSWEHARAQIQTHPMFTKCCYLQKTSSYTQICLNLQRDYEEIVSDRPTGRGCVCLDEAAVRL